MQRRGQEAGFVPAAVILPHMLPLITGPYSSNVPVTRCLGQRWPLMKTEDFQARWPAACLSVM